MSNLIEMVDVPQRRPTWRESLFGRPTIDRAISFAERVVDVQICPGACTLEVSGGGLPPCVLTKPGVGCGPLGVNVDGERFELSQVLGWRPSRRVITISGPGVVLHSMYRRDRRYGLVRAGGSVLYERRKRQEFLDGDASDVELVIAIAIARSELIAEQSFAYFLTGP